MKSYHCAKFGACNKNCTKPLKIVMNPLDYKHTSGVSLMNYYILLRVRDCNVMSYVSVRVFVRVCLCVRVFVRVCLCILPFLSLSVYVYVSFRLCVCPCMFVCPSRCLSVYV